MVIQPLRLPDLLLKVNLISLSLPFISKQFQSEGPIFLMEFVVIVMLENYD
jgi:hypothetical protein